MLKTLFSFTLPWSDTVIPIYSYPFFLSLGILLGTLLMILCARRYPDFNARELCRMALYLGIAGYLGARIWFILVYAPADFTAGEWLQVWNGGLAIQGGIIGGFITLVCYCLIHKKPLLQMLDISLAGAALGNMFARIGCFLNGCCWGTICREDFPLAVHFPSMHSGANHHYNSNPIALHDALIRAGMENTIISAPYPVHPVQLYMAGGLLLITLITTYFAWSKIFAPGTTACIFIFCYSLNRFIWEFYRDDSSYIGPLHPGQITAAIFLALSLLGLIAIKLYHKQKNNTAGKLTALSK